MIECETSSIFKMWYLVVVILKDLVVLGLCGVIKYGDLVAVHMRDLEDQVRNLIQIKMKDLVLLCMRNLGLLNVWDLVVVTVGGSDMIKPKGFLSSSSYSEVRAFTGHCSRGDHFLLRLIKHIMSYV